MRFDIGRGPDVDREGDGQRGEADDHERDRAAHQQHPRRWRRGHRGVLLASASCSGMNSSSGSIGHLVRGPSSSRRILQLGVGHRIPAAGPHLAPPNAVASSADGSTGAPTASPHRTGTPTLPTVCAAPRAIAKVASGGNSTGRRTQPRRNRLEVQTMPDGASPAWSIRRAATPSNTVAHATAAPAAPIGADASTDVVQVRADDRQRRGVVVDQQHRGIGVGAPDQRWAASASTPPRRPRHRRSTQSAAGCRPATRPAGTAASAASRLPDRQPHGGADDGVGQVGHRVVRQVKGVLVEHLAARPANRSSPSEPPDR